MSTKSLTAQETFVTITTPVTIAVETVQDILITAFDSSCGGSNHYLGGYPNTVGKRKGEDIFESFAKYGQHLRIVLDEESGSEVHILTRAKFIKGLRMALANGMALDVLTNENPADSVEADSIIQYALFGELIYG